MRVAGVCVASAVLMVNLVALAGSRSLVSADASKQSRNFVAWARRSLTVLNEGVERSGSEDLDALGARIADASVVALGEGVHLAAEPLSFRNRLFQYLVEAKGFTAIAIESGLLEGHGVDDYVSGGTGDLPEVLQNGIGWTFDRLPQNAALVRWMREYNADRAHARKLHFYGFDLSGSPGNPRARLGPSLAAMRALDYLKTVDPVAERTFRDRMSRWLPYLTYDFTCRPRSRNYTDLTVGDRARLSQALSDLVGWLENHKAEYLASTSAPDFAWGYQAAKAAQQVDRWFRALPSASDSCVNPFATLAKTDEIRDRIQAENLNQILEWEGVRGRLLVFAHSLHLSQAPVDRCWGNAQQTSERSPDCSRWSDAGTYWSHWYGSRYFVLASLVGRGSVGCGATEALEPPASGSVAEMLAQVSSHAIALDLTATPASAEQAVKSVRPFGPPERWDQAWEKFRLSASLAFDILVFFPRVTPACAH